MISESVRQLCEEDLDFIVSEMETRHQQMQTLEGARHLVRSATNPLAEATSRLIHKPTSKEFLCGREAVKRFDAISDRLIKDRVDAADWNISNLSKHLQSTLLTFLFDDGIINTHQIVGPWLESGLKSVRAGHRCFVHYIPCVAVHIGAKEAYSFGPITFKKKEVFFEDIEAEVASLERARKRLDSRTRRNASESQRTCMERFGDSSQTNLLDTFRGFSEGVDWIAVVPTERCDYLVSEKRAEAAVRISLSSTALFLQGDAGIALRIAGDPFESWNKAKLSSTGSKMLRPRSSWKLGVPTANENWPDYLKTAASPVLSVIEELVRQTVSGIELSYGFKLAMRAISLYADALRDTNVETRLMKLASGIECILLPSEAKARETFVIRGSMLAQRDDLDFLSCAAIASDLYRVRSDVVHGNISEIPSESSSTAHFMRFARNAVLQFVAICAQLKPLGSMREGTKGDLIEFYKQCELRFASEIAELKKLGLHRRPRSSVVP